VRYVPPEEKAEPEPPKPPRGPVRRLTSAQRQQYRGRPSWNGKPKRDWDGLELPTAQQVTHELPLCWAFEPWGRATDTADSGVAAQGGSTNDELPPEREGRQ
jgi:hypothetical protein